MSQSRRHSALEACVNVAIGFVVSLVAQMVIFPVFGIYVPLSSDVGIGAAFTVVSLVRSFVIRRLFDRWNVR